MEDLNAITADIVDAAVNIHKRVGPGLFESVYEVLMANDLTHRGRVVKRQVIVPLIVDGIEFEQAFRADLIVDNCVVVELKVEKALSPVDKQQILSYTRLLDFRLGLLLNFGAALMKDGIIRVINASSPLRASEDSEPLRENRPQKRLRDNRPQKPLRDNSPEKR